jgi:dTDP-4-amino-4,6-dideoxygalactose transaminase
VEFIPLVDLQAQHRAIAEEVGTGFTRVLAQASFILGEDVARFEGSFASFSGVPYCVGVANGTDALALVLRAVGVGTGDEVILPTNSFIATALAVAHAGATPVLVDCDPVHHLIDVNAVRARVTPNTKAILAVHLYGQLAPMEEIQAIAAQRNILVLADAAQAHGARRHGLGVAEFGVATATSFYPSKNLGAYGDAGAVLTRFAEVEREVRALRNYGSDVKHHHPKVGFNSRLDTLQAVVLNAKLPRLAGWNQARREAARLYDALLADVPGVVPPVTLPGNEHVFHLYVVRVPKRDRVLERLHAAGIGAGIHYPVPIHAHGAFRHLGHGRGDFPVAERAAVEVLSLPLFPEITPAQQERVVSELRKAVS